VAPLLITSNDRGNVLALDDEVDGHKFADEKDAIGANPAPVTRCATSFVRVKIPSSCSITRVPYRSSKVTRIIQ
jgi:hypothetical protein